MWRDGAGGGSRVSAATVEGQFDAADLARIEARFADDGHAPIFQVREGDDALDAALAARGYRVKDPVDTLVMPLAEAPPYDPETGYPSWPPVAVQRGIWTEDGIGPARLAIMERAPAPKTTLLARAGGAPAGTGFVALSGDIAAVHAVVVTAPLRKHGIGRALMALAAHWARDNGAAWLTLQVTQANSAARALYSSLGMRRVDGYHYREKGRP